MPDQTFTFGMTPESVVREAFARECPAGMLAVGAQGMDDVTLQAANASDGDWSEDELVRVLGELFGIDDERAAEYAGCSVYSADEIVENAISLRMSILSVLGIEEV